MKERTVGNNAIGRAGERDRHAGKVGSSDGEKHPEDVMW